MPLDPSVKKRLDEITEPELAQMAAQVRARLEVCFGSKRVERWIMREPAMALELMKQTFLVVRTKLEG